MDSPCRYCEKREQGCHTSCKLYKQYDEENIRRRQELRKADGSYYKSRKFRREPDLWKRVKYDA